VIIIILFKHFRVLSVVPLKIMKNAVKIGHRKEKNDKFLLPTLRLSHV